MTQLSAKAISAGYAVGRSLHFHASADVQVPHYAIPASAMAAEQQRFRRAVSAARIELEALRRQVLQELGESESQVFDVHLSILGDKLFTASVQTHIRTRLINVEQALQAEVEKLVQAFAAVENEYVRQRSADIRDVGRRVLRQLCQPPASPLLNVPPASVIVAVELLPSDMVNLDYKNIVALISERGGSTSHAAILARSLGIPSITGVSEVFTVVPDGVQVLVDGNAGEVVVDPDPPQCTLFFQRKERFEQYSCAAFAAKDELCITADGVGVELLANIGQLHEVEQVHRHNLGGVGLFRTEYLFLEATRPPTLDEQRQLYLQTAQALHGLPMIIRTLDLGGDKQPPFLMRMHELNPNLGIRGLRFSLAQPHLFAAQLQAILQVACQVESPLSLLFPMVSGGEEFAGARQVVERLAASMQLAQLPKIGAMIETPCALFELDSILRHADFLSIGTNDLTQYMLAADRNAVELVESYSMLQPGILRAIASVVAAAERYKCPLCVCGEAAGAPRIAALLVGLGVRQLSISPVRAARVRYALRQQRLGDLQQIAAAALQSSTIGGVRELLEGLATIEAAN